MAINTLERVHTVLHQVFTLAVEDNYILKNPCDDMMGECKRNHNYETPRRHALTVAQQSAFLDYINESNRYRHWSPLFTFFLGTGCRIGEVIGLRWEDVHMDEKEEYIDINHNLVYFKGEDGKCQYHISTPKTVAGRRIIPMLPQVKNALLEERQFQREAELECKSIIDGYTDFIFLNKEGHPHNQQTVNRTIRRILLAYNNEECENAEKQDREAVLLPNFSCHNLRHTFATRLCENETNLKVIQEVLGHKDIATTMNVYAEATKDRVNQSFVGLSSKIYLG